MNHSEAERARAIRAWLSEGSSELSPRVLDGVLHEVPATPQDRPFWSSRWPGMSTFAAVAAVAAALVVVVVGISLLGGVAPGGEGPAAASPPPTLAPKTDLGVFESARGRIVFRASFHLEAIDPFDPTSRQVIELPATVDMPRWMPVGFSADGSLLAFTDEDRGRMYVMDAAGSARRIPIEELQLGMGCCSFVDSNWLSPDGTSGLAFAPSESGMGRLHVLNLDDIAASRVVEVRAEGGNDQPWMPVWSPDGSQVAYVWSKDGGMATPAVGIVDLASGSSRELVSGLGLIRQLAWSPDGSQLLVVAGRDAHPTPWPQAASLYVVDIDDGEPHQIASGHYISAAWSPEGTQIAAIDFSGVGMREVREVVVVDADGSVGRQLLATIPSGDPFTGVVWHPVSAPE